MKCYMSGGHGSTAKILLLIPLICSILLYFPSCHAPGSDRGSKAMDQKQLQVDKPEIDSSRVLNTLELYRAIRYEGMQEAMQAGPDHVYKLVLYGRNLESLPPDIGEFTYLASLDVSHNELSELPQAITELHYLQGFYATHNRLSNFPGQVLHLPVLMKLDLSGNQIGRIPPGIRWMDQLTRLTMDDNILTAIPVEVYALRNLTVLELAKNGITVIPEGISNLTALEKLDLSGNQLTGLPREITTLGKNLKELNIQGNRIPPEEVEWLIEAMPGTQIRY